MRVVAMCTIFVLCNPSMALELITNGGFEAPFAISQPQRYFSGSEFDGWAVGSYGSGDHIDLWWDPPGAWEGNQYVFIAYEGIGGDLSQSVSLQQGHEYELTLMAAPVWDWGPTVFSVVSSYPADTLQNSRVIGSGAVDPPTPVPFDWRPYSFTFTAEAAQERLFFRNTGGGFVVLDNIVLVEVPEPAALSLLALGSLGIIRRRRWR